MQTVVTSDNNYVVCCLFQIYCLVTYITFIDHLLKNVIH